MALINLRNALMAGRRLPYDAEVEFLQSSGMQWIDTGIVGNLETAYEVTFAPSRGDLQAVVIGRRTSATSRAIVTLAPSAANSGAIVSDFGDYNATRQTVNPATLAGGTFTAYNSKNRRSVYDFANGTEYVETTAYSTAFTTPGTLLLGGTSSGMPSAANNFYGKIYACKIWQGGVLVRDYIPVRKGTVGYLYDRVSGLMKPFGNAGTGDFVVGPDVVPVEYIESHGTEWIDTGVPCVDGYTFKADFMYTRKASTYNYIAGSNGGSTTNRLYFTRLSNIDNTFRMTYNDSLTSTYTGVSVNQRIAVTTIAKVGEQKVYVNGALVYEDTRSSSVNTGMNIYLFAASNPGASIITGECAAKMYAAQLYSGTNLLRSFCPVRVGTEGAMMDTLTRRIYRNAGTGAFTYGNDLPYPIPA